MVSPSGGCRARNSWAAGRPLPAAARARVRAGKGWLFFGMSQPQTTDDGRLFQRKIVEVVARWLTHWHGTSFFMGRRAGRSAICGTERLSVMGRAVKYHERGEGRGWCRCHERGRMSCGCVPLPERPGKRPETARRGAGVARLPPHRRGAAEAGTEEDGRDAGPPVLDARKATGPQGEDLGKGSAGGRKNKKCHNRSCGIS